MLLLYDPGIGIYGLNYRAETRLCYFLTALEYHVNSYYYNRICLGDFNQTRRYNIVGFKDNFKKTD